MKTDSTNKPGRKRRLWIYECASLFGNGDDDANDHQQAHDAEYYFGILGRNSGTHAVTLLFDAGSDIHGFLRLFRQYLLVLHFITVAGTNQASIVLGKKEEAILWDDFSACRKSSPTAIFSAKTGFHCTFGADVKT